jgi:hypothetical protein
MVHRIIATVILCALVLSCSTNDCSLNVDAILKGDSNSIVHDYGFGDLKLSSTEIRLYRAGEFPISLVVFKSQKRAQARLDISFRNTVPGQTVGISYNFTDIKVYHFDSADSAGEVVDESFTVDVVPGLNVVKIGYLNSDRTCPGHEYVLGRKRVEFSKLAVTCVR